MGEERGDKNCWDQSWSDSFHSICILWRVEEKFHEFPEEDQPTYQPLVVVGAATPSVTARFLQRQTTPTFGLSVCGDETNWRHGRNFGKTRVLRRFILLIHVFFSSVLISSVDPSLVNKFRNSCVEPCHWGSVFLKKKKSTPTKQQQQRKVSLLVPLVTGNPVRAPLICRLLLRRLHHSQMASLALSLCRSASIHSFIRLFIHDDTTRRKLFITNFWDTNLTFPDSFEVSQSVGFLFFLFLSLYFQPTHRSTAEYQFSHKRRGQLLNRITPFFHLLKNELKFAFHRPLKRPPKSNVTLRPSLSCFGTSFKRISRQKFKPVSNFGPRFCQSRRWR